MILTGAKTKFLPVLSLTFSSSSLILSVFSHRLEDVNAGRDSLCPPTSSMRWRTSASSLSTARRARGRSAKRPGAVGRMSPHSSKSWNFIHNDFYYLFRKKFVHTLTHEKQLNIIIKNYLKYIFNQYSADQTTYFIVQYLMATTFKL